VALDYAVKRTGDEVEGGNTRHSGDHLQAICRALARERLRAGKLAETSAIADVEAAITKYVERPELTAFEEKVVASHEAGHAVVALFCDGAPPIERISIRGDLGGVLGSVRYGERANRHVTTRGELLDMICSLFGGREAEALLLDDLSLGSGADLERATAIARSLVEQYGMGPDDVGARQFLDPRPNARPATLSDATREKIEAAVRAVLEAQRGRARELLSQNRAMLTALRDLLLEKKVLDRQAFGALLARPSKKPEVVRG
jgi:cell division protease FtsH